MLYVSDKYAEAITSDHRKMSYRLKLGGVLKVDQSRVTRMSLNESVGGSTSLTFGTANSSTLSFTLKDADPIDYDGMLVEAESGLELPDGTIEYVPLGLFWVTKFSTSDDYKTVNFTCADGMYHMSSEYESELTYPTSIKSVVEEIVSKAGVEFVEPLEWPNVTVRCKPKKMSLRDAIGCAAGCCGCNARFNRSGKLEFTWYTDHGTVIPREIQYMNGMTKLNYKPIEVSFEITGQKETYTVTINSDGNGGVRATPGKKILEGDTVVISINPFSGYELATISASTENGTAVTLYRNAEGGYTFIQPDSNVTVTASFRSIGSTVFTLTTRANGEGTIQSSRTEFSEGDTALIYIAPESGYGLDGFSTIPSNIEMKFVGTTELGGDIYEFTMPKSDVVVTANFKAIPKLYSITAYVDESDFSPGYLYVEDANTGEFPLRSALPGTHVIVSLNLNAGFVFDHFESSVELIQIDAWTYRFVMPEENVSIVAYYKYEEEEAKTGLYSWLQTPVSPPTAKKNWAVFYRDDFMLPVWKKFYLVWFDSWETTGYETVSDRRLYNLKINGYYYCGSQNTGYSPHAWDDSSWNGNGASESVLNWNVDISGEPWSGSSTSSYADYCLLATNIPLFRDGQLLFKKCENAILSTQTDYIVDGMDVRERGSLTYWKCPDTFSTPAPAENWMIVSPYNYLTMIPDNGKYYDGENADRNKLYIVFFDSISVENIGAVYNNTDEEFYIAHITNGHYCTLQAKTSTTNWNLYDIDEEEVLGLRSSLVASQGASDYLGEYHFSGILASSIDVGTLIKANACRVCECETPESYDVTTYASPASTYSLRKNGIATPEVEQVTISYTNAFIYEKMVSDISNNVNGITYTPAKVKYRGNPAVQAGDIVSVTDKDGVNHTVLVMQQVMSFGGGMNAEITCHGETNKTKSFNANSSVGNMIDEKVEQSSFELEHRLASNNALVYASLYKSIGDTEAKIASVVEWQSEATSTMAKIEQTADDNKAKISLVVGQSGIVNDDGSVQGSIVVQAINGQSKAKISADRLDIEGKTLNIKVASTNITGKLTADQINADGIAVKSGEIGGWEIDNDIIGYASGSSLSCFFLSRRGRTAWLDAAGAYTNCVLNLGGNFGVDTTGKMYANGAVIRGNITVTGGIVGGLNAHSDRLEKSSTSTSDAVDTEQKTVLNPEGIVTHYSQNYKNMGFSFERSANLTNGLLRFSLTEKNATSNIKPFITFEVNGTLYTISLNTATKTLVLSEEE